MMNNEKYILTLENNIGVLVWEEKLFAQKDEGNIEPIKKAVGGNIELASRYFPDLWKKGINIYVNENGIAEQLPRSINVKYNGKLIDIILGNLCFLHFNPKTEDDEGLTIDEIEYIKSQFGIYLCTKNEFNGFQYEMNEDVFTFLNFFRKKEPFMDYLKQASSKNGVIGEKDAIILSKNESAEELLSEAKGGKN